MKRCPSCRRVYDRDSAVCQVDGTILDDFNLDPRIGQTVAKRYRVVRRLGAGSLGTVYLAQELSTGNNVALKILANELQCDDEALKQCRWDARFATASQPSSIVRVYEVDRTDEGQVFVAMEYLEGENLADVMRREGAMELGRALRLASQIAQGLVAASKAGVPHRDLKPQNVLVVGPDERVKMTDFGVARLRRTTMGGTRTRLDSVTLEYTAPEQLNGGDADDRTDIYGLGAVLYAMLTGAAPQTGTSRGRDVSNGIWRAPQPIRELRPDVPVALEHALLRALEHEPERRQIGIHEFAEDLLDLAATVIERTTREAAASAVRERALEPSAQAPRAAALVVAEPVIERWFREPWHAYLERWSALRERWQLRRQAYGDSWQARRGQWQAQWQAYRARFQSHRERRRAQWQADQAERESRRQVSREQRQARRARWQAQWQAYRAHFQSYRERWHARQQAYRAERASQRQVSREQRQARRARWQAQWQAYRAYLQSYRDRQHARGQAYRAQIESRRQAYRDSWRARRGQWQAQWQAYRAHFQSHRERRHARQQVYQAERALQRQDRLARWQTQWQAYRAYFQSYRQRQHARRQAARAERALQRQVSRGQRQARWQAQWQVYRAQFQLYWERRHAQGQAYRAQFQSYRERRHARRQADRVERASQRQVSREQRQARRQAQWQAYRAQFQSYWERRHAQGQAYRAQFQSYRERQHARRQADRVERTSQRQVSREQRQARRERWQAQWQAYRAQFQSYWERRHAQGQAYRAQFQSSYRERRQAARAERALQRQMSRGQRQARRERWQAQWQAYRAQFQSYWDRQHARWQAYRAQFQSSRERWQAQWQAYRTPWPLRREILRIDSHLVRGWSRLDRALLSVGKSAERLTALATRSLGDGLRRGNVKRGRLALAGVVALIVVGGMAWVTLEWRAEGPSPVRSIVGRDSRIVGEPGTIETASQTLAAAPPRRVGGRIGSPVDLTPSPAAPAGEDRKYPARLQVDRPESGASSQRPTAPAAELVPGTRQPSPRPSVRPAAEVAVRQGRPDASPGRPAEPASRPIPLSTQQISRIQTEAEQKLRGRGLLRVSAADRWGVTLETSPTGEVTLTGVLRDMALYADTVRLVREVPGVRDVRGNVEVADMGPVSIGRGESARIQAEIQQRLRSRGLLRESVADRWGVTVEVSPEGDVTLVGAVRDAAMSREAVGRAQEVANVRLVKQDIRVIDQGDGQ